MDACRTLVVDDEPDPGQLVLERLNDNGGERIGMVLTGINVPEMGGFTLLKQVPPVGRRVISAPGHDTRVPAK